MTENMSPPPIVKLIVGMIKSSMLTLHHLWNFQLMKYYWVSLLGVCILQVEISTTFYQ